MNNLTVRGKSVISFLIIRKTEKKTSFSIVREEREKMRTAAKVGIVAGVSIVVVVLLLIISYSIWVNEQGATRRKHKRKYK